MSTYLRGRLYHTDSWVILEEFGGEEKDLSEELTVVLAADGRLVMGGRGRWLSRNEKVRVQFGRNVVVWAFSRTQPRESLETALGRFGLGALRWGHVIGRIWRSAEGWFSVPSFFAILCPGMYWLAAVHSWAISPCERSFGFYLQEPRY